MAMTLPMTVGVYHQVLRSTATIYKWVLLKYPPISRSSPLIKAPSLSCGMARPRGGGRRGGRAPVHLDEIGMEPVNEETLPPPPPTGGEANEGAREFICIKWLAIFLKKDKEITTLEETLRHIKADRTTSKHVCYSKDLFESLHSIEGTILLPNKSIVSVAYSRTVWLSSSLVLRNVLFVPQFRFNLLSVSSLISDSNLSVLFCKSKCLIQDLHRVIGKGENSVVERKHQHLLDVVRALFFFIQGCQFDSGVDPLISQEVAGQSLQEEDGHSSHEKIGCESTSLQDGQSLISPEADDHFFQAEAGHSSLEAGNFQEKPSNANPASASPDVISNERVQSDPPTLIPVQARKSSRITQRPSYLKEYFCNSVVTSKEDNASCTYLIEDFIANTRLTPSYSNFVANISSTYEPSFFHQAVKIPEWRIAMDEELKAMESLQTWYVVPLPAGKKAIACKWVYRIKRKADGTIDRYKARLVAKGFTQIEGIDFIDTFSPVAKMTSFKILLALAAVHDWHLLQLDVNNAFLNGVLDEEVYMQLPQDYNSEISESNMVCKLHKSIYGLKQASGQWFHAFSKVVLDYGFVQSPLEHSLFVKGASVDLIALLVYVDDTVLAGINLRHLKDVHSFLQQHFKLKQLGPLKYFLGFEIARNKSGISLSQCHYALQFLEDTGNLAKKPHDLPISAPHNLNVRRFSKHHRSGRICLKETAIV
ncbi:hypothetical protein GQ457_12G012530 [Hibiscus cannabinus]